MDLIQVVTNVHKLEMMSIPMAGNFCMQILYKDDYRCSCNSTKGWYYKLAEISCNLSYIWHGTNIFQLVIEITKLRKEAPCPIAFFKG